MGSKEGVGRVYGGAGGRAGRMEEREEGMARTGRRGGGEFDRMGVVKVSGIIVMWYYEM